MTPTPASPAHSGRVRGGFDALAEVGPAVTIFGSARVGRRNRYYGAARRVAEGLAREGFAIITGGGPGIMEAANRGAKDGGGCPSAAISSCRSSRA